MSTIISHSKKFIFIHNYKVAGISISAVLSRYEPLYWVRTALRRMGVRQYYPALANYPQHAGALVVRDLIGERRFSDYYKFTFVRNPWDWQVSLYHYMRQSKTHYQHELVQGFSFDDYINWRVHDDLQLQCTRFSDQNGDILADFVGRFENLEADFEKVCGELSIGMRLPHKNRSRHTAYRDYYTDRTRALVQEAFARDIDLFGYEF